jgi:hypothetical protein
MCPIFETEKSIPPGEIFPRGRLFYLLFSYDAPLGRNSVRRTDFGYYRISLAQSVQRLTTDWTAGVRSPTEAEDFSSNLCVQTGSGAHPASYTVGTRGSFLGGKARPGRDAGHSPPCSAEVKKEKELYLLSPKCASTERNGTTLPFHRISSILRWHQLLRLTLDKVTDFQKKRRHTL